MRKHFPYLIIVIFSAIVLTAATKVIGPADLFQLNPTTIPSSGNAGAIRYDTSANAFKFYNGSTWGEIGGGTSSLSVVTKSTTYTATTSDDIILAEDSGGNYTITLYTASGNSGKILELKKINSSTNTITIDGNSTETIDGDLTTTINTQYEELKIVSDGTNWHILNRKIDNTAYSFTPTGTWTTNVTYTGWKRRVGDSMHVRINLTLTGAPGVGGILLIDVPDSLTIDTGKLDTSTRAPLGELSTLESGANTYVGMVRYDTTTTLRTVRFTDVSGTVHSSLTDVAPFTYGNGDEVSIKFMIPISGWKGN